MPTTIFDDWTARGLVHQATATGIAQALDGERLTGYIGFDPTAPSLHVGSLLPVTLLMRLERAGHRPIALVGGGTGMIGDPSGKSEERQLLDEETLEANVVGLRNQLERFLDFGGQDGALLVNNLDWLGQLDLIGFLRDVAKHFSVNSMIARESVRRRLDDREHGISYTEFSYSLLQAYDYLELHDRYGCTLQMGGSDQWGNIVAGADLVRRQRGATVHGLTSPLVTRSDGKKFGKSEQGNIWLDPELTTPFELYQFFLNTGDTDVAPYLAMFTFLPLPEIEEIGREVARHPEGRAGQRRLAEELTRMVHGDQAVRRAENTTRVLFEDGELTELTLQEVRDGFASSPSSEVERGELEDGLPIVEALVRTGLAPSKGRGRQDVTSGAVSVNHVRETDPRRELGTGDLVAGAFVVLRRGKKTYHLLRLAGS